MSDSMIDVFINSCISIIGYELDTVQFTEYKDNAWYFYGTDGYDEWNFKCTICTVGIAMFFQQNGGWYNYGLIIQSDLDYLAKRERGSGK